MFSDSLSLQKYTMSLLEAKVKSVLSGDTVILHNVNNPKQERTLSLAFVSAPRIRREGDEVSYTLSHECKGRSMQEHEPVVLLHGFAASSCTKPLAKLPEAH